MGIKTLSLFFSLFLVTGASHAAVLNLITLLPDDLVFQQTSASPCVIGGPNCQNGGFPQTLAGSGGPGTEFDETSPLYTTAQILDITVSSSFMMGLDYNDTSVNQILRFFGASYFSNADGTGLIGSDTYTGPTSLKTNNNGVGYSDFLLDGFMIPVGTQSIQFRAQWFNNDGADRYFLIGGEEDPTPNPVPEPATSLLIGAGLLSLAWLRKLRNKNA